MPSISPRTHTPSRKPRRSTWLTASVSSWTVKVGSVPSSNSRSRAGWLIAAMMPAARSRQVLLDPVDGGGVGRRRLGGVVAGTGVIEEGVVDAGQDAQLMGQSGRRQRRLHGVPGAVHPGV